ncbi:unnamed protein product [Sympodiomycopsis kandeliae]
MQTLFKSVALLQFLGAALLLCTGSKVYAAPTSLSQTFFSSTRTHPDAALPAGVGHFSEWSAQTKAEFLDDVKNGKASNWTVVMGNEGGDLDSMAAAFTWAYHLGHVDPSKPAIGLLQTPEDALDLRPENKLALENVKMSKGHSDLLTIDELPIPASELATMLRGVVLVDHPSPVAEWENATVLSIFDHHADRGVFPHASPRIFLPTASCSTIVGKQMLDEIEALPEGEYHLPHELLELLLSAIAIDSKGLESRAATPTDKFVSSRLFRRSNWREETMYQKMVEIAEILKKAKKDLGHLGVRDLLRRDWKGSVIETPEDKPDIHTGYASIPYSLSRQITLTPNKTLDNWFDIERNFNTEIHADTTIALLSYKRRLDSKGNIVEEEIIDEAEDDRYPVTSSMWDKILNHLHRFDLFRFGVTRKIKERQIVLIVGESDRLNHKLADELYTVITEAIESYSEVLEGLQRWRGDGNDGNGNEGDLLGKKHRRMVWTHQSANGGRKLIRPIVDDAVKAWKIASSLTQ